MGNLPKNATMDPVLHFGITIIGAARGWGADAPSLPPRGGGHLICTLLKRGEVKCENVILKEK